MYKYILKILMHLGNIGNFLFVYYWFRTISYEIIPEDLFMKYYPHYF